MGMVIGIDVGGSTTKIIGVDKEGIKHPMIVRAADPITSLFGAFGKYIYDNNISLGEIEKVMLTGLCQPTPLRITYRAYRRVSSQRIRCALWLAIEKSDCCKYGNRNFFRQSGGRKDSTYRRHRYRWRNHSGTIQIIAKDTRHSPSGRNGTKRNSGKHRFTDKGYLQCRPAGAPAECHCIHFWKSRQ